MRALVLWSLTLAGALAFSMSPTPAGPAPKGSSLKKGKDLAVVAASGPLAGQRVYGNSYALLIGVNEYANLPKDRWLSYAANDVQALREVLIRHYGFSPDRMILLLNKQATLENIRKALARLADKRKVGADDRILVYFSGHGQTVKVGAGGDMGFLIPHDADVDLADMENAGPFLGSCLPMKAVWDYLVSSPAKHVLLLADACYSGLLAKPRAIESINEDALASLASRRAVQVVTAGRRGEVSYELSQYGHGAFTYKLLEELKARASTPGAVFTTTELYAALKRSVANLSRGKQTPQMGDYDTEGDFLFITAGKANAPAAVAQPPKRPQAGQVWVNPKDGAEMVFVPAGEFWMGGNNPDSHSRETPIHAVFVPPFYIDKREVTNTQYARFLNETGGSLNDAQGHIYVKQDEWLQIEHTSGRWRAKHNREEHPVLNVTWFGVSAYAKWASKRLPTEAEWEKAARGTDRRQFPWGSEFDSSKCQSAEDHHGHETTAPVGRYLVGASPYGCLDMAGNVWEWTSSLHSTYPYKADDGRENGTAAGLRVARGGSWGCYRDITRLPYRHPRDPGDSDRGLGFRCAMPAGPNGTPQPVRSGSPAMSPVAGGPASHPDHTSEPKVLDLFNGTDLSGWQTMLLGQSGQASSAARWKVDGGILRNEGGCDGIAWKGTLAPATFTVEMRLRVRDGMRFRLHLHPDCEAKVANEGYMLQFGLFGNDLAVEPSVGDVRYAWDQWYTLRLEVDEDHAVRLLKDGVLIQRARRNRLKPLQPVLYAGDPFSPGHIEIAYIRFTDRSGTP